MAQFLAFQLGESQCVFPVAAIQEILPTVALSRVPGQELPVEGMLNLRGTLLPVLDLRSCFGLAPAEWKGQTRIIVIKTQKLRVGVVVDGVEDVVEMEETETTPPAGGSSELVGAVLSLSGKALTLLRPERLAEFVKRLSPG